MKWDHFSERLNRFPKRLNRFPKRLNRQGFLKLALSSGVVTLASLLEACNRAKPATPTPVPPTWTPTGAPLPTGTLTRTPSPTFNSTPARTTAPTIPITPTITLTPPPSATPTWTPTATPESLSAGLEGLDIEAFLDGSARRLLMRDPEGLSFNGLADLLGVREEKLTDVSDGYIRATQKLQAETLELLRKYDKATLNRDQLLNVGIYEWYLDDMVRGSPFMYNNYLVMPFLVSLNSDLHYLFTDAHSFDNEQDAQNYVTRLGQVKMKLEQALDGLKRREAFGVILPKILIPDLIEKLKVYTGFIDSHPFYITLVQKGSKIKGLHAANNRSLLEQAKKAIKESVIPGYRLLIDYFEYLQPIAPQEVGVWRFSNGADYYAHLLRHYTTTEISAEEIHQLGVEHVARISDEMRATFGKLGYPSGESLETLVYRLGEDEGYISGEAAEAAYRTAIEQAVGMLGQVTDIPLKDPITVVGGAPINFFQPPPLDGSRPPTFYAVTVDDQYKFLIKDIAFHEAVPGHGYQADVARQLNPSLFRNAVQYDAYLEGWALYAEYLMWELGAYEDDPAGNIGRLWMELMRAMRCVLDTAIHTQKWTYARALQYTIETMGSPGEGEVRRYIMLPAQAPSYYVGYLKILELRQKAKGRLGSRFDLKQFHHVLLASGQVPLAMLEQLVETYITANL